MKVYLPQCPADRDRLQAAACSGKIDDRVDADALDLLTILARSAESPVDLTQPVFSQLPTTNYSRLRVRNMVGACI